MVVGRAGGGSRPCRGGLVAAAAVLVCLLSGAETRAEPVKRVVVIYPDESDGSPGLVLTNRAIRSTFADRSPDRVEVHNEYVAASRLRDTDFMRAQVALLRQKYAGRKVDLVMAGLSSGLDFAVKYRDELFPGVPVVYVAVDEREVQARRLPPDVIGVPVRMDLAGTLDLALRLHPDRRRVFVVAGAAPFDAEWAAEARRVFGRYTDRVEFVYLTGLPMPDLLGAVAGLPADGLIYYLHIQQDGAGFPMIPAEALDRLAAAANAPVYGHVDTYVGRGAVGGRVFRFEAAGENAARLGLRVLAGEKPGAIPVPAAAETTPLFDWRQLRRWGVGEHLLPEGSVVRYRESSAWDRYRGWIVGGAALCVVEALLIAWLLFVRGKRRRAEEGMRTSRRELQALTRRLLEAQETERRRVARELHDDVNQVLALIAVEMDLLGRDADGPDPGFADRVREVSARVKELSSAVHDLSHQLHPSKLEQLGLVSAIRGLCLELRRHHGLDVEFTPAGVPDGIPEATALCLYRVVQEALRNVVKHSGAGRAGVVLTGEPGGSRLVVSDGGAGFDPSAGGDGGLGLVSMRERLHLIGGSIAIKARPGEGTRVEVFVPTGPRPDHAPGTNGRADHGRDRVRQPEAHR